MKLTSSLQSIIISSAIVLCSSGAFAQAPHFNALVIDAGGGQTITLQPPATGWTGNLDYQLPIPPNPAQAAGFVEAGSADGQYLTWDNTNQVWTPGGTTPVTGTGTSGYIPEWNASST